MIYVISYFTLYIIIIQCIIYIYNILTPRERGWSWHFTADHPTKAAHRQKLDDALRYLQLLPSDAGRILTPSAAAQVPQQAPVEPGDLLFGLEISWHWNEGGDDKWLNQWTYSFLIYLRHNVTRIYIYIHLLVNLDFRGFICLIGGYMFWSFSFSHVFLVWVNCQAAKQQCKACRQDWAGTIWIYFPCWSIQYILFILQWFVPAKGSGWWSFRWRCETKSPQNLPQNLPTFAA